MPRRLRVQAPEYPYHVTTRGDRRERIYRGDDDRWMFLALLDRAVERFEWRCHAYCLMGNHYHLAVEAPNCNLSAGMQYLNGRYAQLFNAAHGLDGHSFGERFYSDRIDTDRYLAGVARYIALNPVRAQLCAQPEEWRWSSYGAFIGIQRPPSFLSLEWLEQFGRTPEIRRAAFKQFVDEAPERARAPRPVAARRVLLSVSDMAGV